MSTLVAGLFTDQHAAGEAIAELKNKGYIDNISFIAKNEDGEIDSTQVKNDASEGAISGAGIGAVAGAIGGVVIAALPGAPLVVAGPLAAMWGVSGAALGALSGGLIGALVDLGFDRKQAEVFEDRLLQGDMMIAVSGDDKKADEIVEIMEKYSVYELTRFVEK